MLQAKLSVLPKELLIKILLKVKEEKIYKVKIRNGHKKDTFYVKAQSRDDVLEKMRNNKEIRSTIIEMFKDEVEYSDMCLYIHNDTYKVGRFNYHCVYNTPWQYFRNFDNHKMLLKIHFNELFDDYIGDEDQTNISIEEIKIIPKFQL